MKKRIFIIVASVLVAVTVLTVTISAALDSFNGRDQELAMPDRFVREEASEEKIVEGINKVPEKVIYHYTQEITEGQSVDIYKDENGVSYETDPQSGEVVGYYNNAVLEQTLKENESKEIHLNDEKEPSVVINGKATKEQAILIAEAEAKRIYGEEYKKFKFLAADQYVQDESYFVQFGELWGKDDFAIAREIRVHVAQNGDISSCVMFNREAMMGKDESILDGVTREIVEQDVRRQRIELGEDADSFEIQAMTIEKNEDSYRLAVLVKDCTHYYYYPLN